METLANLPFIGLAVDREGALLGGAGFAVPEGTTDLVVISHGWKNDEAYALKIYRELLEHVQAAAGTRFTTNGRRWAVAGVFWPAFRYRPDLSLLPDGGESEEGDSDAVGGAVGFGADSDLPREELAAYAAEVGTLLGDDALAFAHAALAGAGGGDAADALLDRLRAALTSAEDLKEDHRVLLTEPGSDLVATLAEGGAGTPLSFTAAERDEELGGAAGFRDVVKRYQQWRAGGRQAVATVLNQATYYEMKARAGTVGRALAPVVEAAVPLGVRVHLIGHSFGARLVSALADSLTTLSPASLVLLQGAFSHNGFGCRTCQRAGAAEADGVFRRVLADRRISGPILITHTRNDTAVGFFYAIASTLTGTVAANFSSVAQDLIGGPDDRHGGIGANGALSLRDGEALEHIALHDGAGLLLMPRDGSAPGAPPAFAPGMVHNVRADAIITDHNDVHNPRVGALAWAALA